MAKGEGQECAFRVLANEPVEGMPGKRRVRLLCTMRGLFAETTAEYEMLVDAALAERLPVDAETTVELLSVTMTTGAPLKRTRIESILGDDWLTLLG